MVIRPGDAEGDARNRHRGADQWLCVVSGTGIARVNGRRIALRAGTLLLIEHRDRHEVRNTGRAPLRTLNLYVQPAYAKDGEPLPRGKPSGVLEGHMLPGTCGPRWSRPRRPNRRDAAAGRPARLVAHAATGHHAHRLTRAVGRGRRRTRRGSQRRGACKPDLGDADARRVRRKWHAGRGCGRDGRLFGRVAAGLVANCPERVESDSSARRRYRGGSGSPAAPATSSARAAAAVISMRSAPGADHPSARPGTPVTRP